MLNYIRAECYKLLRRKYTYIVLAVMLALEGLVVAANVFHNAHSNPTYFGECIVFVVEMGLIGFATCMFTGDIVFAGQYKNSTLKNEVSFGLSRTQIYLGKLIAQTLLSVVYLVLMMGFFVGMSAIFLPHTNSAEVYLNDSYALLIVGYFLAVGLPLWIGTQAVCCACEFSLQSDVGWNFGYVGVVFVLPTTVELVGLFLGGPAGQVLTTVYEHMPSRMLNTAKSVVGSSAFLGKAWLVGLFWVALSTAVGLYSFRRKEIK